MVSFALKALLALPVVTAEFSYPSSLSELVDTAHRQLKGCHTCDCFTCDSVVDNGDGFMTVTVGHCKGDTISWMCCVGRDEQRGNCQLESCSGSMGAGGAKCQGVTPEAGLKVRVPVGTKSIEVNTHDGKTSGSSDMLGICGGKGDGFQQGKSCGSDGSSAHCLLEFYLERDCGYTPPSGPSGGGGDSPDAPAPDSPDAPAPDSPDAPAPSPSGEEAGGGEAPGPSPGDSPSPDDSPEAPDAPSPDDRTTPKAFTKGDPHFKTFGGELYDYHGECDLVLLHNPTFKDGLGMDIHIRTKIEAFWSSVESAVIKVGENTMEIKADPSSDDWIWFNGELPTNDVVEGEWHKHKVGGFLVRYKDSGVNTREANLYLKGSKEVIILKTFKSFVRIDIDWEGSDNYEGAVGLLGSKAHNGQRLGRDGQFIENHNAFGQEWQVRPEVDGSLFHSYEGAVVGKKCKMPPKYHKGDDMTVASLRGRRLGAGAVDNSAAEKACNHLVDLEEIKACVFDVLATQDLNMASTW